MKGPDNDAWAGFVSLSTDGGKAYSAGQCLSCKKGTGTLNQIVVDGDGNSGEQATATCLGGATCGIQLLGKIIQLFNCAR